MKFFSFLNRAKNEPIQSRRRNFGYSGGTLVNSETAMQSSAFYRGVIYLSSQLAKLRIDVKDKNNVAENDAEIVTYLLNVEPNPETTAFYLKLFLTQCALIEGNGYCEIERYPDGRPKNLWPLNPRKVTPVRANITGELLFEVNGGGTNGETIYLRPRDLYIYRNLHTKDAISGLGVVGYMLDTLGISLGADKFANSLFANGGMPSSVLKHPGRLSDEAYKRLEESWKEDTGGRKTGGTAILEEGMEYSPISHSPDVMQFLESRKFSVVEIARFLGVPPSKLFDQDSKSYNSLEQENLSVISDTLDAWSRNIENEIDIKLLSKRRGGYKSEFDLYSAFRGDMDTRSQYFSRMLQNGTYTPNQILLKEGMPTYKGGDRRYIASNNFSPIDRLDEIIDADIKSKEKKEVAAQPSKDANQTNDLEKAAAKYLEEKIKN